MHASVHFDGLPSGVELLVWDHLETEGEGAAEVEEEVVAAGDVGWAEECFAGASLSLAEGGVAEAGAGVKGVEPEVWRFAQWMLERWCNGHWTYCCSSSCWPTKAGVRS